MVAPGLVWRMIKGNRGKLLLPVMGILLSVSIMVAITALAKGGKSLIENDLSYLEGESITLISKGEGNIRDIQYLETLEFVNFAVPKEPLVRDIDSGEIIYGTTIKSRTAKDYPINIGERTLMLKEKGEEPFPRKGIVDISAMKREINTGSGIAVSLKYNEKEYRNLLITALNQYNPRGKYVEMEEKRGIIWKIRRNLDSLVGVVIGVATGIGALISVTTVGALVRNHRGHIGMLKAVGARDNLIFGIFLLESFILASIGATLGVFFGILISKILGNLVDIKPLLKISDMIGIWALTLIAAGTLGIIPARQGARLNPVVAIRKE